ncbi:DEAD/DEAH box helicase [Neorhizobium galegae]|uniref:SNF2-related protein n=1 Tax=Neorhizobium galegae TaxID=399 RepID=UPI00062180BE|nr:DEAD/DEAH box helicase [Neorhizobium galegae]CDZ55040.1 Protein RGD1564952 [Neorhizobium galegae bv. orientalis]
MQLTPFPTQLSGAEWLSLRRHALLADEPRVGKTGTAILAADYNLDDTILVVTTASGRPVWKRAFPVWSPFGRQTQVVTTAAKLTAPVCIVGWPSVINPHIRAEILKRRWDRVILDEAHKAKNFDNKSTQSVYGALIDGGAELNTSSAIIGRAKGVWPLTGTPLPHDPSDAYPMMRALCPERLLADPARGWPDVTRYEDFRNRYCKWRPKKLNRWKTIIVIMGGKNEAELRDRLAGFMLLRTQQDVGIRPPVYETLPLAVSEKMLREVEGDVDRTTVLEAARNGSTRELDTHLGPLRRLTGEIKARAVVEAVKDEFDGGLDKIVLAYWHKDVGQILKDGLYQYGVVGIDGASTPDMRGQAEQEFLHGKPRVFLGQIEAAGEAIDLSSASVLWFVESVFSPKSMKQMSLRITNHTQTRQAFVRVCVLEGSIDEAVNESLLRLWTAIREVLA